MFLKKNFKKLRSALLRHNLDVSDSNKVSLANTTQNPYLESQDPQIIPSSAIQNKDQLLQRDAQDLFVEEQLAHIELPAVESVCDFLAQVTNTEYFKKCEALFTKYPQHALINAKSRAILYILTRFLHPNHVLEIGTYRAGSSEIIARALRSNSKGMLTTIDPFGQAVVPPILESWAPDLKRYVNYLHLSSMECFIKLANNNISFDLIFIDGDHSYEYALYDLQMAARHIVPGGIVIMDNAEQTGVYWAAKAVLCSYSGWRELGTSIAEHDIRNPYATMKPSIAETSFLILQAPERLFINHYPRSFETKNVEECGLSGFDLFFTGDQHDGYLNALIFFRSFMHGGRPGIEQMSSIERFHISAGCTSHRLLLSTPFITQLNPKDSYRTYEIILSYTSNEHNALLEMKSPPVPIKISDS